MCLLRLSGQWQTCSSIHRQGQNNDTRTSDFVSEGVSLKGERDERGSDRVLSFVGKGRRKEKRWEKGFGKVLTLTYMFVAKTI